MTTRRAQAHLILHVTTFDEDPSARPAMHIWTSHDTPWLLDAEDIPRYPEWHPGR